jgi:hypothetical protein
MTIATEPELKCIWCEEPLSAEELERPRRVEEGDASAGEPICDECYQDEYQFICDLCLNSGHVDDQHNFLLVFDVEGTGLEQTGLYRITRCHYYLNAMIWGYVFAHAVERIGDLPHGAERGFYPCGHLCADCQKKIGLAKEPAPDA